MAAKAPLLRPASVTEPHKAQIEFEVTPGNTHAALRFYSVKGTQFYDAQTQKLVDAESKAIKLLPQYVKMTLIVLGLEGDVDYSATVRFRGLDDINWSPESPRSKPCRLVLASKMGPPLLVPEKEDEMKLICSMPPRAFSVAYQIYSHEGTVTTPHVVQKDGTLLANATTAPGHVLKRCQHGTSSIVVAKLDPLKRYSATVCASNGTGCGPWSEHSGIVRLADSRPRAPCPPLLEEISQRSVRVLFSLPATGILATIYFKKSSSGTAVLDQRTSLPVLISDVPWLCPSAPKPQAFTYLEKGVIANGLSPDTTYQVYYSAKNAFGWGDHSPRVTFKTLPDDDDVVITHTRTQEERDAEKKKDAIDVEDVDAAPARKRPKRGKDK